MTSSQRPAPTLSRPSKRLDRYRLWFYAAAIYNFLWGSLTVLFPDVFFH